jgi:hypothetical protein
MKKAATLTAASADQSGSATVRMTHDGQLWTHKVVRWHGDDLEITDESPGGSSSGLPLLVVNGMMYGHDPDHEGWVQVGPVSSIDPGSGTTPTDILAAVREDMGGGTLRRITGAMTAGGLTTTNQLDGSTVYRGNVPAGQIARQTGFKEGQAIRVFPFGYVAHDAAADPRSLLDTAVTAGPDGVIREIAVTWGNLDLHRHLQRPRLDTGTCRTREREVAPRAARDDDAHALGASQARPGPAEPGRLNPARSVWTSWRLPASS